MLIGLLGTAGSGKDTVANYLVGKYQFKKIAISSPIKDMCQWLFDLSCDVREGPRKEEIDPRYGVSPRFLWQQVGSKMRDIRETIWIEYLMRQYQIDRTVDTVIADVRLRLEIEVIQAFGGKIWRIVCLNNPKDLGNLSQHATEQEQQSIPNEHLDGVLTARYGEIPQLFAQADILLGAAKTCLTMNPL